MKYLWTVFYLSVLLLSNHSLAQNLNTQAIDGKREAFALCQSLYYSSEKDQCSLIVTRSNYFESSAVSICGSLYYTSEKINCVGIIADKFYEDYEASACNSKYYTSEKLTCLKTFGKDYNDYPGDGDAIRLAIKQLRLARSYIASGDYRRADNLIKVLIERLERE